MNRIWQSTVGSALLVGLLAAAGCGQSDAPEKIPDPKGVPQLSAAEIDAQRRQLERGLMTDSTAASRPSPLISAGAPLTNINLMPEWGLRETAADALARIGPASIPALLRALESEDPAVRARATLAFARMGPEASPAVGALARALQDPDADVRRGAARALGQIGPAAETAIPALAAAMTRPEPEGTYQVPAVAVPPPGSSPSDQR